MSKTRSAPAPAVEPTLPELLNSDEVIAGLRISYKTLKRMIATNELRPDYKIKGKNFWTPETVAAYVLQAWATTWCH